MIAFPVSGGPRPRAGEARRGLARGREPDDSFGHAYACPHDASRFGQKEPETGAGGAGWVRSGVFSPNPRRLASPPAPHQPEAAVIILCRKCRVRHDQETSNGHAMGLKAALNEGAGSMV